MPPLLLPDFPPSTQDEIAAKTEDLNTIIYGKLDTGSCALLQRSTNASLTDLTPQYEFKGKLIIVFGFVGGCLVVVGLLIAYVVLPLLHEPEAC